MKIFLRFVFLIFCSAVSLNLSSQFNLKIGFNSAYSSFETNNLILQDYNAENDFLEQGMKDLHVMHGVVLGLRYRWGNIGVDVSWENLSRNRDAFGEDPTNNSAFTNEIFYTMNSFSAGLENYFGVIGYGAAIESRRLRVKTRITGLDKKRSIMNQTEYSARFYLLLQLQQSNKVSLVIRPYVQFPFESNDFNPLEDHLLTSSSTRINEDKLWVFGLSFLFYNGPQ